MIYYTHSILIYKTLAEKVVIKWLFKYHFLKKKTSHDMIYYTHSILIYKTHTLFYVY